MGRRALGTAAILAVLALAVGLAAGCSDDGTAVRDDSSASGVSSGASPIEVPPSSGSGESITIYSGQHRQTATAVADAFRDSTGIGVSLRSAPEGELASQVLLEGSNSPADIFYAGNSPALEALDEQGLLAPVAPSTLAAIPRAQSSPKGHWVGASARASVLVYNTDQLARADLPESLLDLAKPEWKGRFGFPPSETDFQPLVTSVSTLKGEDAAKGWLEGLKDNGKVYDNNEGIIAAVNRGEIAAGLIEHYYWYRLRNEIPADDFHVALHYFPRGDPGHLLVVSGAGMLASSKHAEAAQRFLSYVVSPAGQEIIATSDSYEYPLRPGVTNKNLERPFASLIPPALSVAQLGDGQEAFRLLQDVGLL
jgi:iron(III) transport system substrate-binding protein